VTVTANNIFVTFAMGFFIRFAVGARNRLLLLYDLMRLHTMAVITKVMHIKGTINVKIVSAYTNTCTVL
jgi:hypothetical protein